MITSVTANGPKFKPVEIEPGFNLMLAEQTKREPEEAEVELGRSTNGSGKTFLLLVCHFCLGSKSVARDEFQVPELAGWEFSVLLELKGRTYEVTRSVDEPGRVRVRGDLEDWGLRPEDAFELDSGAISITVEAFSKALGVKVYGLDGADDSKNRPTFGGLFRYSIRHGINAFHDPFKSFVYQKTSERDVSNAVLLGIDWRPFRDARRLLKEVEDVKDGRGVRLKLEAGGAGAEAEISRLQADLEETEKGLTRLEGRSQRFTVHPEYAVIEERVSDLDATIRKRSTENVELRESLGSYLRAIGEDGYTGAEEVRRIYAEAAVDFPEQVARRLEEAEKFARRLAENRREYLQQEIERLEEEINDLDIEVERLGKARDEEMRAIDGRVSAEQLSRIRDRETQMIEARATLKRRIEELMGYQRELDRLDVALAKNKVVAQTHFDSARGSVGRVAKLFEEFTESVLGIAGRLRIEVRRDGALRLDMVFGSKKSQGTGELLVFCYDLALAAANSERDLGPQLLFHDSSVFDGVDPRQKAKAIELATEQSRAHGFRYLLCINEGDVPWEYLDSKELRSFLRGRITDKGDGGLLGIRFGEPD